MTAVQSKGRRGWFEREIEELCHLCHGTGRVMSEAAIDRAKRGGNMSYLASLSCGRLSMGERGKRGGRPKEKTIDELRSL